MLDESHLARYEAALQRLGVPIVDHWRPGLSDDQIDRLVAQYGVDLPEEARRLWRWHDGASLEVPYSAREIAPGRIFVPLDVALESYEAGRGALWDLYRMKGLMRPFTAVPLIYLDCAVAIDAPVPVLVPDESDDERPVETLPSIGALFDTWTGFIQSGLWTLRDDGTWDGDYILRMPPEVEDLGVF